AWKEELPKWAREACTFSRGFVNEVSGTATAWLKDAARLARTTPLAVLHLSTRGLKRLGGGPPPARLPRLRPLRGPLCASPLRAFAASTYLGNLRGLYLRQCDLGPEAAQALAAASLSRLERLNIGSNRIGPAGTEALASSRHLAKLARLVVDSNSIGPEGARALASSARLKPLADLDLAENGIGLAGTQALVNSPLATRLTSLNLGSSNLGDAGVRVLAECSRLARLTELTLYMNGIGPAGAAA